MFPLTRFPGISARSGIFSISDINAFASADPTTFPFLKFPLWKTFRIRGFFIFLMNQQD